MKYLAKWIPALIIMSVIFFLSSMPGQTVNSTIARSNPVQMLGHFTLFMLLCASYYRATKNIILSLFLTLLYAFFDEFRQSFIPERSSSIDDVFVDMAGASLFVFLLLIKNRYKKPPEINESKIDEELE